MSSRSLDDLDSRFRPIVEKFMEQCNETGIPLTVVCTLRDLDEQRANVAHGVSWTLNSKHLPQPPDGKALAIDVCPTALLSVKYWAPASPLWWKVAEIGVALGMRSGMDWNDVGLPLVGQLRRSWDAGHFEMRT